ncbi:MAG: asparagine synthase (glutamine-hydrolyzing) [Phycisphaerales bacterium]
MCGLIGVVTSPGRQVSATAAVLSAACDMLAHRGPDGAGVWRDGNAALAHRRLAVLDLSDAGAQPMVLSAANGDTRLALAYNGELYNDAELRAALNPRLAEQGLRFTSSCDTETLGRALLAWGEDTPHRIRGMYAFAAFDPRNQTLTLARDPLGIKPLYWARWSTGDQHEVAFASEVSALVQFMSATTGSPVSPDLVTVSAYLTTIRTTLGDRTLFKDVRAVEPGQWISFNLREPGLPSRTSNWWDRPGPAIRPPADPAAGAAMVRECLRDSVHRHLRSDVPVCALLSGGLDSSITTALARREKPDLLTFAAGAAPAPGGTDDISAARECASFFDTNHHEALVDEPMFHERWRWMVDRLGIPLSTANEVAINQVARTLRADGCVVTLSGEGADELFAGYDQALDAAADYIAGGGSNPGAYELEHVGWAPLSAKPQLLRPEAWRGLEQDQALVAYYSEQFDKLREECDDPDPLAPSLRWQRKINLVGLLQRLDTAMMLEGVEGRTPFADVEVVRTADALPLRMKFAGKNDPRAIRTKLVLRDAFRDTLPAIALDRPKASFPLPFAQWMQGEHSPVGPAILQSQLLRALFRDECLEVIAAVPGNAWRLAWPMTNLALWERRWWG